MTANRMKITVLLREKLCHSVVKSLFKITGRMIE